MSLTSPNPCSQDDHVGEISAADGMGYNVIPLSIQQHHGHLLIELQAYTHSISPSVPCESPTAWEIRYKELKPDTLSTNNHTRPKSLRYPCHHPMEAFRIPTKGRMPRSERRQKKLETALSSSFNFVLPQPSSSRLTCPFGFAENCHTMSQYSQDGQATWYMCEINTQKGCPAHKQALLSEAEVKAFSDLGICKWIQVEARLILAIYDRDRWSEDSGEKKAELRVKFQGAPSDPTSRMKAAIAEAEEHFRSRRGLSD